MRLAQIGLINWANLDNRDYAFDGVNLVTGPSGTGKTTLLDAIQTLMTAAKAGLFQYNPGQDEASQQSRNKTTRTLASYILGCDETSFARPYYCSGYIIGVFVPDTGEVGEPFSAVFAVSADLEESGTRRAAKENERLMLIVPEAQLSIDHFIQEQDGVRSSVKVSQALAHLKRNYPRLTLRPAQNKGDYLAMLYGAFQGKKAVNVKEAEAAAKQFANFMAYKKTNDLDEFVRQVILEPKDLSDPIRHVATMMRNIDSMRRDAQFIRNGLKLVEDAQGRLKGLIKSMWRQRAGMYEDFTVILKAKSTVLAATKKQCQRLRNEASAATVDGNRLKQEKEGVADRLEILKIKAQGMPLLARKESTLATIQQNKSDLGTAGTELLIAEANRGKNYQQVSGLRQLLTQNDSQALSWLPQEEQASWQRLFTPLLEHDPLEAIDVNVMVREAQLAQLINIQTPAREIDQAYQRLTDKVTTEREALGRQQFQTEQQRNTLANQHKALKLEIERMEGSNRITYPTDTRKALALLHDRYPEADARVLCDHIEVSDPHWQLAIEGIVGNRRFGILVNPDFEEQAVRLLRKHGLSRAQIIQGEYAQQRAYSYSAPSNSIVNLMQFTHALAESFMLVAFGNVAQVKSFEELKRTPRGLMANGQSTGGFIYRVNNLQLTDLVFGKQARQRALNAKKKHLEQLHQELTQFDEQYRCIKLWVDGLNALQPLSLEKPVNAIFDISKKLSELQHTLEEVEKQLAESEYADIDQQISDLSEKLDALEVSIEELTKKAAVATSNADRLENEEISDLTREIGVYEARQDAEMNLLLEFEAHDTTYQVEAIIDRVDAQLDKDTEERAFPVEEKVRYTAQHVNVQNRIRDLIKEFNVMRLRGLSLDGSQLTGSLPNEIVELCKLFQALCLLGKEIDEHYNQLVNDILAKHERELKDLSNKFNETFITHLCHQIYNNVNDGAHKLRTFNNKLKKHRFGEEHYKFNWEFIDRYQEYFHFLKEIVEASQVNLDTPLFDDNNTEEGLLSDESQQVFCEIQEMLIGEGDDASLDRSIAKLKQFADYRSYYTYDILKILPDQEISLKSYGTGSGGQLETPSYVIRAAGLSSSLKFGDAKSNLRLVLIDESFAKMDEQRSHEVINYLADTLGLQVLFVVPAMKSGAFVPLCNKVFEVTKVKSTSKRGELDTRVLIADRTLKKDRIQQLVHHDTKSIEQQTLNLSFEDMLVQLDGKADLEDHELSH